MESQIDQLKKAGCERIFKDTHSAGRGKGRNELDALFAYLRPGDQLVVAKLDRLARSLKDLLDLVETIKEKGAHLKSLHEKVDTSTEMGRLILHVMGMLAEFERDRIRERTLEGLEAARARGRIGGRPPRFNAEQRQEVVRLRGEGRSLRYIAKLFNVAVGTVVRALELEGASAQKKSEAT